MGTVFLARRALLEAKNDGWPKGPDAAGAEASGLRDMLKPAERVVLREVIEGKRRLRLSADTDAEIRTALRLGEEFGMRVQIEGGREALRVIPEIKAAKADVILDLGDGWSRYELEANPYVSGRVSAELAEAGIPFAFGLESSSASSQFLERAAMTQREGLSAQDALRAITINAARVLGVDGRVGSIEAGKDADFVAISGDPLAITSSVLWVMVDGVKISNEGIAEDTTKKNGALKAGGGAAKAESKETSGQSKTSNTF